MKKGRQDRIAETLTISVSLSQTPPARSSISEARPFPLEWQSCHALSYNQAKDTHSFSSDRNHYAVLFRLIVSP